jgi:hypothetical protein
LVAGSAPEVSSATPVAGNGNRAATFYIIYMSNGHAKLLNWRFSRHFAFPESIIQTN